MTFCLYGSEDALNDDLEQILKDHSLEVVVPKVEVEKKAGKAKNRKKEEEVIKGIEKIEIGKEEK